MREESAVQVVRSLIMFAMLFAFLSDVHAKSVWTGTQVITPIAGEFALNDEIGVRAHMARFMVPKTGFAGSFIYLGPTFARQIGHGMTLWLSPQATSWLGWFDDQDAFGGSIWVSLSRGQRSLFLEGDYVLSGDGLSKVYYGYYAYDRATDRKVLNYGIHAEQTDRDVDYGPHIGLSTGVFHTELQYYLDFEGGDIYQAARLVMAVNFFGQAPK